MIKQLSISTEKLFKKINTNKIQCLSCARKCIIPEGFHGFCGVRYNVNNQLILANWGLFIAIAIDPIEKKPFYHFYPGSSALSLGTTGCSWACKYCQNWDISQRRKLIGIKLEPEEIVELAKVYKELYNITSITFTYNEPSIYPEYQYEVAKFAKKEGFNITWVTNGYLTDESIQYVSKFIDAMTIDIKGNANNEFARKYILIPDYEPVLNTIEEVYKKGVHVEITDLIVPKVGDNLEDAKKLSKFLYDVMGDNSNIHFLRFFPHYKMENFPPTDIKVLEKHAKIAKEEGIQYVYIGNVPGHELEHTYCPNCKKPVIKRYGFRVYEINLDEKGRCKFCGTEIYLKGEVKKSKIYMPKILSVDKPIVERMFDRDSKEFKEIIKNTLPL